MQRSDLSLRVAQRYLLSRAALTPAFDQVQVLVRQDKFDEALEALDEVLLRRLGIRTTRSSESFHVLTEWSHALDPGDESRFIEFARSLSNLRGSLFGLIPRGRVMPSEDRVREGKHRALDLLDDVKSNLVWVESVMREQEDEFTHGPFKILLMANASDGLDEALKTLDAAADKVRSKFPGVLYGKVYVRSGLKQKGTFDPAPQSGGLVAGSYVAAGDFINLSLYATPDRNSVMTLIHEFGHRYHTRFLHGDAREKFIQLSTVGDVQEEFFSLSERRQIADEYLALFREHQKENYPDPDSFLSKRTQLFVNNFPRDEYRSKVAPLVRQFRDDKDNSVEAALRDALARAQFGGNLRVVLDEAKLQPQYASMYGMMSWQENFAEAFLAFVLGKALPKPIERFMVSLA